MSRSIGSLPRVNPDIHGMLAIGYEESEAAGAIYRYVYVRTSWGSGEGIYRSWSTEPWLTGSPSLHVRGVIGFHPRPKIRSITRQGTALTLRWDGPVSRVPHYDQNTQAYSEARPHRFQLRRSPVLSADPRDYAAFGPVTKERTITVDECCGGTAFYRVMLLAPP